MSSKKSESRCFFKLLIFFFTFTLLYFSDVLIIPYASGAGVYEENILSQVSHPSMVPKVANPQTVIMQPGDVGTMIVNLTNRYAEPVKNVTFSVEVYNHVQNNGKINDINSVKRSPAFGVNKSNAVIFFFEEIAPGDLQNMTINISSVSFTPEGVYSIRNSIEFTLFNNTFIMKSPGHFTIEEMDAATNLNDFEDTGFINLAMLGVHGILPDMNFVIRLKTSYTLFYLIFIFSLCSGIAGFYYLHRGE